MPDQNSSVFAPARLTEYQFADAMEDRPSRATVEAYKIWKQFIAANVDPSFALGQFWVESLLGTAGHAQVTKNWGNILWGNGNPAIRAQTTKYSPGNGYSYISYPNWSLGVSDYIWLLSQYREQDYDNIYKVTARWIAKVPGSDGHLKYMNILLGRMKKYDSWPRTRGESVIFSPDGMSSTQSFVLRTGRNIYKHPDDSEPWFEWSKANRNAAVYGYVHGTSKARLYLNTGRPYGDRIARPTLMFVSLSKSSLVGSENMDSQWKLITPVGMPVYKQPGDATPWFTWVNGKANRTRFMGRVNGSGWAAFLIRTTRESPDGKYYTRMVFTPDVDDTQLVT